jgi:hypothetical protein
MKVKVGSIDYDLKMKSTQEITDFCRAENVEVSGLCSEEDEVIFVSHDSPSNSRDRVFFHELTHAMLFEVNQELSCDENFVDAFSKQLYAFHKNNKLDKIINFIHQ